MSSRLKFAAPSDVAPNWLPRGYRLVTDRSHVLRADDALLPVLSNDWRLVGDVNGGARVGLLAEDAGDDLVYIATLAAEQGK